MTRLIVDQGRKDATGCPTLRHLAEDPAENELSVTRPRGRGVTVDRSSRPHRQPHRTRPPVLRKILHRRWKQRLGPIQLADRLGMQSPTAYAVRVRRCRLNQLTHIDRAASEPISRLEHETRAI